MQKRPKITPPIQYVPYNLPTDFPVGGLIGNTPSTGAVTHLHAHNCLEIGICLEGAGVFFVDNKVLPYKSGDVSIIFKNQIHIAQSDKSNPSWWKFAFLEPDKLLSGIPIRDLAHIIKLSEGNQSFINILPSEKHPNIVNLVSMIIDELEKGKPGHEAVIRGLVWAFMVTIGRIHQSFDAEEERIQKNEMLRIAPALEYIFRNYMNEIRVETLASLCNMSITNFRRVFNACIGLSPMEYIVKVRIQIASVLLKSTDNLILDIALKVGYTSLSSFNRHFKSIMRVSPREWRKKN
jgi:AraC-like DNA-binding protein